MATRRELMQWLAASTGVASLESIGVRDLFALGREAHRAAAASPAAHTALDPRIAAAAEIILPGATAAGVGAFVDRMLAGWYAPAEQGRFLAGLHALDDRCRTLHGADFTGCTPADQTAVLTAFDAEVTALRAHPGDTDPNQRWFAILKYLTIWGYCTSSTGAEQLGIATLPMRYDGNAAR